MSDGELEQLSDDDLRAAYAVALAELGIESELAARQALDVETAELVEELSRIEAFYPLAAAALWVAEDQPYDQRRLVLAVVGHALTLVLGGNRSGKTFAILELLVAYALGGDHPAVRAWLEDNRLPLDLVPHGPGECYAVAGSASASMKLHRREILPLLPDAAVWYGFNGMDEARVEIPVPGHATTATIWFKSCRQGHESFKGGKPRFVAISEEPTDADEGRLILAECMRGTSTSGGRVVLEMTPQNGYTWVHDDLERDRKYGCELVRLNTDYNVMLPDYDSVQRYLNSLSEEEQRMRRYGEFVSREGLVHARWSRGDGDRLGPGHLCDDFDVPSDWPRFRTHDWGQTLTNGTAALWGALAPDGTLFLYLEYYLAGEPSFRVHAQNVRALGEERNAGTIECSWGDHEPEAIDAFAEQGLYIGHADKTVVSGLARCETRMLVVAGDDNRGRPRLKVFRSLSRFIYEIEQYRRDPNKRDGSPIKRNDHVMDCWRYMENGIAEWQGVTAW